MSNDHGLNADLLRQLYFYMFFLKPDFIKENAL